MSLDLQNKIENKKKAGILTLHYSFNYGALLQCYALLTVLQRMGVDVKIINYQRGSFNSIGRNRMAGFISNCKIYLRNCLYFPQFVDFRKKYLQPETKRVWTPDELKTVSGNFDAVLVGSDQVWRWSHTREYGYSYYLDFVPDNVTKLSYAASFGIDEFEGDENVAAEIKMLLKRFAAVSVRENTGIKICKEKFDIDATWVLDPALLLDRSDYEAIIRDEHIGKYEKPFIGHYLLSGLDEFKSEVINKVAQHTGIKEIKNVCSQHPWIKNRHASVASWLCGIRDSEIFITNSFHGVVFSIIFEKQFICIGNRQRGNSRMESLLNLLGLAKRIVYENDSDFTTAFLIPIDYANIYERIRNERINSFRFLSNFFN